MTKAESKYYRYSICFKQKVVEEIKEGASLHSVSRKYGIRGSNTVRNWIKQLGQDHLLTEIIYVKMKHEQDEVKSLQKEVQRLKLALADATLERDALESLLEVANEYYGVDMSTLKKNFESRQSGTA
ncbi:MAG: transposase, partial [Prevotellaceae bacterium]|nr:transposase [Prevotellaceae bacterium]